MSRSQRFVLLGVALVIVIVAAVTIDVHKDVERGGSARFRFPASIAGKFVVELEGHKQALANVTVEP